MVSLAAKKPAAKGRDRSRDAAAKVNYKAKAEDYSHVTAALNTKMKITTSQETTVKPKLKSPERRSPKRKMTDVLRAGIGKTAFEAKVIRQLTATDSIERAAADEAERRRKMADTEARFARMEKAKKQKELQETLAHAATMIQALARGWFVRKHAIEQKQAEEAEMKRVASELDEMEKEEVAMRELIVLEAERAREMAEEMKRQEEARQKEEEERERAMAVELEKQRAGEEERARRKAEDKEKKAKEEGEKRAKEAAERAAEARMAAGERRKVKTPRSPLQKKKSRMVFRPVASLLKFDDARDGLQKLKLKRRREQEARKAKATDAAALAGAEVEEEEVKEEEGDEEEDEEDENVLRPAAAKRFLERAEKAVGKRQWRHALLNYTMANSHDPQHASTLMRRAGVYVLMGMWKQVVTDVTTVLKLHDEPEAQQYRYEAMLMRARAYKHSSQPEKAKTDIHTLVSWADAEAAERKQSLQNVHQTKKKGDAGEAKPRPKNVDMAKQVAEGLMLRAEIHVEATDFPAALADLATAMQTDASNWRPYHTRYATLSWCGLSCTLSCTLVCYTLACTLPCTHTHCTHSCNVSIGRM
jgi:hypothetical protein